MAGITLIALVVTVIVLLILAGISIMMLTGDNGILKRAGEAKKNTETVSAKEQIQLEVMGSYGTDGKLDMNKLKTNLEKIGATVEGENPLIVTLNGQTYIIDSDGHVEKVEDEDLSKLLGINAKEVKKNAKVFYGSKVTGYTCKGTGVEAWRIFYADNENIYLIADDYISINDAPKGKNESSLFGYGDYMLGFNNVYKDYSGSSWILENSKAKKWLNKYFNYTADGGTTYPNKTSTNINIRAVAYMMDTSDSVWGKWANADLAEYAIGGPTIEMYVASCKDSHPESRISCDLTGTNGYTYTNQFGVISNGENNEIYGKVSNKNVSAMWLASPLSDNDSYIVWAQNNGQLNGHSYDSGRGLRPIVCLKSEVRLEKVKDEEYKIKGAKDVVVDEIETPQSPKFQTLNGVAYYYTGTAPQPGTATTTAITASNMGQFLGKKVTYVVDPNTSSSRRSDGATETTYRIFYIDVGTGNGKYGDGAGTIYLKQDCDDKNVKFAPNLTTLETLYNELDDNSKMAQLNPDWAANDNSIGDKSEKAVAYLSNATVWQGYKDAPGTNQIARYVVGAPSIEMFVDSYNKFIQYNSSNLVKSDVATTNNWTGELETAYNTTRGYGYKTGMVGDNYTNASSTGSYGPANNSLINQYAQTNSDLSDRVKMYNAGNFSYYWLASPSAGGRSSVVVEYGRTISYGTAGYALCPLVSCNSNVVITAVE